MKAILIVFTAILFLSCNKQQKEFADIKKGMQKSQVETIAGEPTKKTNVGFVEMWTYDAADRTIIFRSDTVFNIITSSEARLDSIQNQLKEAGQKIEDGAKETGQDINEATKKIKNKADTLRER